MATTHRVIPGDEIEFEIQFNHNANMHSVEMIFGHQTASSNPIEFYESQYENPAIHRRNPDQLTTLHTVRLRAEITADQPLGSYRCISLVAVTAGGSRLDFQRIPGFVLEVVQEPMDQPMIYDYTARVSRQ